MTGVGNKTLEKLSYVWCATRILGSTRHVTPKIIWKSEDIIVLLNRVFAKRKPLRGICRFGMGPIELLVLFECEIDFWVKFVWRAGGVNLTG